MNKYNPNRHHRRSIRLKGYDYSQAGLYFITLCCHNRIHLFGGVQNGSIILNPFGQIVDEEWKKTAQIRNNIALHEYIIMPNHFHAILEILFSKNPIANNKSEFIPRMGKSQSGTGESPFAPTESTKAEFKSPSQTIGAIIRGFKGATTKRIKEIIRDSQNNNNSTGESQFAPTAPTAPTEFAPRMGESPFAPTTEIDLDKSIWQRNYYEHIIRNKKSYQNITNYIINNPANWKNDKFN